MAGEATGWRRGRKVCHWREHQIHPPRSHSQANTQVMIVNNTDSVWRRVVHCNPFSPIITPVCPAFLSCLWCWFFFLFSPIFPALFKPIQRLPWILLCTWPSTSHPHRGPRWSVSCPLWRRRHPPSGRLASPPGLAEAQLRPQPQPKGAWLSNTCSCLRPGLETEAGGANVRVLGSCQVTDESLVMILTKQEFRWLTSIIAFCKLSYMLVFRSIHVFWI